MKKFLFITMMVGVVAVMLIAGLPRMASAAGVNLWPTGFWGPILSCTAAGNPDVIDPVTGRPLPQCTSLCNLIETGQRFIYVLMSIGIFAVAPVLFVWGGIRIMTSGDSPTGVSEGKKILTGTVVGVFLTLAAFQIVVWVMGIIGSSGGGGTNPIKFGNVIECKNPPGYTVPTFTP